MKELKRPENIYLEEYDVNLRPYLTLQEQQTIVNLLMNSDDLIDRKIRLITGIVEFCTDIPTDDDSIDINDIIISGLWGTIYGKMYEYIEEVNLAVERYDSMDFAFSKLANMAIEQLDKLADALPNENQLMEIAKKLLEKDGDK